MNEVETLKIVRKEIREFLKGLDDHILDCVQSEINKAPKKLKVRKDDHKDLMKKYNVKEVDGGAYGKGFIDALKHVDKSSANEGKNGAN